MDDAEFRRKIASTEIELEAVELTTMRALAAHTADKEVGAVSSLIKIRRTEVQQMISELGVKAAGFYALTYNIGDLKNGWNEEPVRSEKHTSELQSLMHSSYDVFCVKNKTNTKPK